jgi:hypothetical protein
MAMSTSSTMPSTILSGSSPGTSTMLRGKGRRIQSLVGRAYQNTPLRMLCRTRLNRTIWPERKTPKPD